MSKDIKICEIDPEVQAKLKKFRYRKEENLAAIVLKIDPEKLMVVEDETYDDIDSIDEVVSELSEHLPRYVIISYVYKHDDKRVSYPLCFVFVSPAGTKPELMMMYAGSKLGVQNELGMSKVFEVREIEEFTDDWLRSKIAFFK